MNEKITIFQIGKNFSSNQTTAIDLASTQFFGEIKEGKVVYNIHEVLYLLEKDKAELIDLKNKKISINQLKKKLNKDYKHYLVFRDLRNKGMIVKEGLKFGSEFRVYEKGKKPGKDHAKYLLFIVDSKAINLRDFCARARVAHSTSKMLLIAAIDSEADINYYEVNWKSIL